MKFKAKAKGFLAGLEPVIIVATKGTKKDYITAGCMTLVCSADGIQASADGGLMRISNTLDNLTSGFNYECIEEGTVSVRALDIRKMLQSFNPEDEIILEVREATAAPQDDSEEPSASQPANAEGTALEQPKSIDTLNEMVDEAATAKVDQGKEVACTLVNDPEELQTLQCLVESVKAEQSKFDEDTALIMDRVIFVESAKRIAFAQGFEDFRPMYLYWIVRFSKGSVRFVAGSGGRFAVLDMIGDSICNAQKKQSLLFHNMQTPALIEVFQSLTGKEIHFLSGDRRLTMKSGSAQIVMSQIDPNIKWPDESILLDRASKIKFTTRLGNWLNAVRGISATYSGDIRKQRHVHTASITFDSKHKMLFAKANDQLKSNRKVTIDDIWTDGADRNLTFKCVSQYLAEAVKNGEENEYIQVEINDEVTPIILRYHAGEQVGDSKEFKKKHEMLGIDERYTIFFAPRTKDK